MPEELFWLIFLLPVASLAIISLVVRPLVSVKSRLAGLVAIVAFLPRLVRRIRDSGGAVVKNHPPE